MYSTSTAFIHLRTSSTIINESDLCKDDDKKNRTACSAKLLMLRSVSGHVKSHFIIFIIGLLDGLTSNGLHHLCE